MRSQEEIKKRIKQIEKTKSDPTGVQVQTLLRKLNWKNARPNIHPKYRDSSEERKKWNVACRIDEKSLLENIETLMDKSVSDYYDHDYVQGIANVQVFVCLIWLMGGEREEMLNPIFSVFYRQNFNADYDMITILKFICKEFNFKWSTYEQRYNPNYAGLIIPKGGE